LTVIVVSEWPSRSCRSRAIRLRSFSAARRATSERAAASSAFERMMLKKPNIASPTRITASPFWYWAPACHDGTTFGPNVAAIASTASIGNSRSRLLSPMRATVSTAM